ncbi:hypothetical protein JCM4814A_02360 [Streptomyces phaeofaciens JCM 4814]|uniref:Uncharacterized protein n=1 Tax=Streptomyces phaeofaciens TaxID=68254 RepID=A0A918HPV9_9ACTN|nr:hypothetical protein GCM10010226_83870 [Streptomyces phaeofaciens]
MTAWRRLRDWTKADVWPQRHEVLPAELRSVGLLDTGGAAIVGSHAKTLKGGSHRASPVDRARPAAGTT